MLNLHEIVEEWSLREYLKTATRSQKRLYEKERLKPKNYLGMDIDWSEVTFVDITHWPRIDHEKFEDEEETKCGDVTGRYLQPINNGKTKVSVLFSTKYTNDTSDSQEYTMRTQKTTRSTCETSVECGFTRGKDMSVTLKMPGEILEVNAGYTSENTLTSKDGQTFEEEISWGVESVIKVKPGHVADAELVVNEKKISGKYEIVTKISGTIYVTFTKIKDNNAFVKLVGNDISDIVQKYIEMKKKINLSPPHVSIENSTITITTKGNCLFRYGIKQEVVVHQEAIIKI